MRQRSRSRACGTIGGLPGGRYFLRFSKHWSGGLQPRADRLRFAVSIPSDGLCRVTCQRSSDLLV